ncbi:uncharacterized protein LOC130380948 [Gadus chalcogrammus]|uniref:uncharacterized protein LOC130380948 n=1 Tax=Gadus chalcogrammus TaxID=1042646 RepID=UPI0024C3E26F|nr:uncharacterized protein LOC130380948 [Gadus chalcogrammus]
MDQSPLGSVLGHLAQMAELQGQFQQAQSEVLTELAQSLVADRAFELLPPGDTATDPGEQDPWPTSTSGVGSPSPAAPDGGGHLQPPPTAQRPPTPVPRTGAAALRRDRPSPMPRARGGVPMCLLRIPERAHESHPTPTPLALRRQGRGVGGAGGLVTSGGIAL